MSWRDWIGHSKQAAPEPAATPRAEPYFKVPAAAVERSKRKTMVPSPEVFGVPEHPPGVGPKRDSHKIAMDSTQVACAGWANGAFQAGLGSFWTEGITFLGYAYLAELAQRPEYRMISETIATEMTRKWIEFTSTGDEGDDKADKIKELEAEFKRLNVRDMFCRAIQQDGFFGRGHIYIDTGDSDKPEELRQSIGDGWDKRSEGKIAKGAIKSLRTVEAVWCYPTSYNSNDPLQDNWYRPDEWYVQAKIVHSSRLLTFIGREVPDLLKPTYSFGGLSLSQMAKPYVDNWLQTRQGVNDIINAFSVFVLLTNMGQSLQGDGDELFKRLALFANCKDNLGVMAVDKNTEEFKNVSAPIAGLAELQAQAQEHMCAVAHTPTVKLLGIQPAGLNADSEGIMRAFYDYVNAYQEHLCRDKLRRLMGLVMINLWGKTDPDIDFKFVPLYALDEKGAAEVDKLEAEADQVRIDSGVLDPAEVRKAVVTDAASRYAGLDADAVPDLKEEEEEGLGLAHGKPDDELIEAGEQEEPPVEREAA